MNPRNAPKLLGSAALALATFSAPLLAQDAELIVGSFGGAYDEAVAAATVAFEEENNVKVTLLPGGAKANIPRARNGEIDMIIIGFTDLMRLQADNLLAPLDPELVPLLDAVYPQAIISEYGVVANFGARALAYNTATIDTPPESWADLADPKYKGRVTLRPFTVESVDLIVMLAKGAGGDERNPEAGFEMMGKIADNVDVIEGTHPGILELFRNDEVDLSIWSDGRIAWAADQGVPVGGSIPKEGFSPLASSLAVVAGTDKMELAQKYVNFLLDDAAGIKLATDLHYFPTKMDIVLPEGVSTGFVNADTIDSIAINDWAYLTTVYDEWAERWEREILR